MIEIPYNVIELYTNKGNFILSVVAIDEGTSESVKRGGITADFNIKISVKGISADFKCMISIGNLYAFYCQLQEKYRQLSGEAVLKDYSEKLTNIVFGFHKTGKCKISGYACTGAYSGNKIEFCLECDQTYINPVICSLKLLFAELAKLQGYYDFPY